MIYLVSIATALTIIGYIYTGFKTGRNTQDLGDLLPLVSNREAKVKNATEFSASTVATTISLATVVLAFFELAPYFGAWLLWTVITTSLGLLVVRITAPLIWKRMATYRDHRPTLHEFLGAEYNAPTVALVGAACTSLGFLGAFAVELTVGSRFFSGLIPGIPTWIITIILTATGMIYTAAGGFRAVIVTDRIQMATIWILLISLSSFYIWYISGESSIGSILIRVPPDIYNFSWREGLFSFLVGIFIINVPTFLSDMSVWQRIAGCQHPEIAFGGLRRSVASAGLTWGMLVLLSCLVPVFISISDGQNPLIALLYSVGSIGKAFPMALLFLIVLGLYGAMLSTASTQLITVTHTVYEDIISRFRKATVTERISAPLELRLSRIILFCAAFVAMGIVESLSMAGFSIADLVFAIYGAQLGLFPPVVMALFCSRERLYFLSKWASGAISLGFVAGWGSAILGKIVGDNNLIFLSPVISLSASSLVLCLGIVTKLRR